MLQYITLNKVLEKLVLGDKITFHPPSENTVQGEIRLGNTGYYCSPYLGIFEKLEIYDANTFVREIVGYDCRGLWPEVKTLDDFKKVIKALDDECIKKWGALDKNTPQFKVGDKVKILSRNGSKEDYYPQYVNGMQKYAGRLATITKVTKISCQIDLDDSSYYWPFNVLQLVTSEMDETVDLHELKNGDYIKITSHLLKDFSLIYIFKEVKNKSIYRHVSYDIESKTIDVNSKTWWLFENNTKITYATEEESKLLDEALLKEGYRWNNLTKQLYNIGVANHTKEETQTETELNLFPKKKHYQLNFNY